MGDMRRKDREMGREFAYSIIDKAEFGTLTMINADGSPYSIPISVARQDSAIYIHSAYKGAKIENIERNPKVCMSFVGDVRIPFLARDEAIGECAKPMEILNKLFTTEYESAVIFGTANIVEDRDEKILGLRLISEKYVPENMQYFNEAASASLDRTCIIRIDIEKITGKRKKYDENGTEMKWGRIE